ncbi:MAG: NUDIX domain-containing protein [Cyclobacteriaceae bacterium]|nr:NUDIX domain-containing protein [Cyclobacteriaceae bacterium]
MPAISSGLLMYRRQARDWEFFLVHPGGPYFRNKDAGSWSIPKGLIDGEEQLLNAAIREFQEETGILPHPPFQELGSVKQKGGKRVHAWAFQGEWDPSQGLQSNTFELEWPPRSGNRQEFPEIDRAGWFRPEQAEVKILEAQIPFLQRALELLL